MRLILLLLSLCVLCVSGTAFAGAGLEKATNIAVSVLAHDAKFIGSAMGGRRSSCATAAQVISSPAA